MKKMIFLLAFLWTLCMMAGERENEAKAYFDEYKRMTFSHQTGAFDEPERFKKAEPKLIAALMLAPKDEAIRYAELDHYGAFLRHAPAGDRLELALAQLERMKKFRQDFPNSKKFVFFSWIVYGESPMNYIRRCPSEQFPAYLQLSRELREGNREEWKSKRPPCDLSDGIESFMEIEHLSAFLFHHINCDMFFGDQEGWLTTRHTLWTQFLHGLDTYVKQHPGERQKIDSVLRKYGFFCPSVLHPNLKPDMKLIRKYLETTGPLCEFAQKTPFERPILPFMIFDAMRETYPEETRESCERACKRLFERIGTWRKELLRPGPDGRLSALYASDLSYYCDFVTAVTGDRFFYYNLLKEYQLQHGLLSESTVTIEPLFSDVMAGKNGHDTVKKLTQMTKILQEYSFRRLKKSNLGSFDLLLYHLFLNDSKGRAISDKNQAFFTALNADFELESRAYWELTQGHSTKLDGAAQTGEEVLLVFSNKTFSIRDASGNFSKGVPLPASLSSENGGINEVWKKPLAFTKQFVVFCDRAQTLYIYDRTTRKWNSVADFSPVPVRTLLIHDGWIYALAGDNEILERACANYFFRIKLSGTNREILFSSQRSEKLTPLDSLSGGLSGLNAHSKKELVFLISSSVNTTIWRYRIQEQSFDLLSTLPSCTPHVWLNKQKNQQYYVISGGWSNGFYQIDPDSQKARLLFVQSNAGKVAPSDPEPARLGGSLSLRGPWVLEGDFLWCGGINSALLNLKKINEIPPPLILPESFYLFELADGRKLFLGKYRYFLVKRKGTLAKEPSK